MNQPLVSICIPTYRGAEFIGTTLQSVVDQTYRNLEIVVLDDNSPDETLAVVGKFPDSRIRYLRNPLNLGPQGNWNRCLELATGKYFKLLPHDDLLSRDCIENQVRILEADTHEKIALVFGARKIIKPDNSLLMERGTESARRSDLGTGPRSALRAVGRQPHRRTWQWLDTQDASRCFRAVRQYISVCHRHELLVSGLNPREWLLHRPG